MHEEKKESVLVPGFTVLPGIINTRLDAYLDDTEMKSKSKPLEELLQTVDVRVVNVITTSYQTIIGPGIRDAVRGENNPGQEGGYAVETEIEVSPAPPMSPLKKITFNGYTNIESGDRIRAVLAIYDQKYALGDFEKSTKNTRRSSSKNKA